MLPGNLQSKSQQKTCLLMTICANLQIAKKDKDHEKVSRRALFLWLFYFEIYMKDSNVSFSYMHLKIMKA